MTMLDLAVFYDPGNWTRGFWEYGSGYTIVKGRHIGLDIGTQGQAKKVPALLPGPIVDWVDTTNLGRIYIQDVRESGSEFNYLSYCHMSRYNEPRLGISLHQGETFGRLATGPKSVGFGHANYPGSAWTGTHLHLVWHNKVRGAYMLGQNDRYGNPEDLIRNILSTPASGGLNPIPFPEDEMTEDDFNRIQAMITDAVVKVQESTQNQLDGRIARIAKAVWNFRITAQKPEGGIARDSQGREITFPAEGVIASTNAGVQGLKK